MNESFEVPSVAIVPRIGHETVDGKIPLKVRLTFNRKAKDYPVMHKGKKLFVLPDVLKNLEGPEEDLTKENKPLKTSCNDSAARARTIAAAITRNLPFTWERFESEYKGKSKNNSSNTAGVKSFFKYFEEWIEIKEAGTKPGTTGAYSGVYNNFKAFRKGKDLSAFDITVKLLTEFEAWLRKPHAVKGGQNSIRMVKCETNGVANNMRMLKTIYNNACDDHPELHRIYPFKRSKRERNTTKYKIKRAPGHKGDALSIQDLKKFINLDLKAGSPDWTGKLLWLLSFHCQGMNMADMAILLNKNVRHNEGAIQFYREKTIDSNEDPILISIVLDEKIKEIIKAVGTKDKSPDAFLFPFFKMQHGLTPEQIKKKVRNGTRRINEALKRISEKTELPEITTYWARHTYAGVFLTGIKKSMEQLAEDFGHADLRTTKKYGKRFLMPTKVEAKEQILTLLYDDEKIMKIA